jgi:hypothetical protein
VAAGFGDAGAGPGDAAGFGEAASLNAVIVIVSPPYTADGRSGTGLVLSPTSHDSISS